ncbi:MAG: Mov34/MPN/PAD-1 family protein [Myxococcales bacterium]
MPKVHLPPALERFCDGRREVEAAGATLRAVLLDLERQYPGLAEQLFDESHALRRYISVLIGEQDARTLGGLDAPVGEDAPITLLPAIAGGESALPLPDERGCARLERGHWLQPAIEHCERAWPSEACGLVFGKSKAGLRIAPVRNALAAGRALNGYEMDPVELLAELRRAERGGERLIAIYHSHPCGSLTLSAADKESALGPGHEPLWPGVAYLVVGVNEGRATGLQCFEWDGRDFVTALSAPWEAR